MSEYKVRIITREEEGLPGAVLVGTSEYPDQWRFGSYMHYWDQVAGLDDQLDGHGRTLIIYEMEAADAPPSLAEYRQQRLNEFRAYLAMLAGTRAELARRFDAIAEAEDNRLIVHRFTGIVTEAKGQPAASVALERVNYHPAHVASRA